MIRSTSGTATAQINADFEGQQLYNRANGVTNSIVVNTTWQEYTTSFSAPKDTWKTFVILKALRGTVEFDNIRMSDQSTD